MRGDSAGVSGENCATAADYFARPVLRAGRCRWGLHAAGHFPTKFLAAQPVLTNLARVSKTRRAEASMKLRTGRWRFRVGLGFPVVFLALQLVSYGRDHANPPMVSEPAWDSPATRALAKQACVDCHSNETEWPAYARIAPGPGSFSTTSRKAEPS